MMDVYIYGLVCPIAEQIMYVGKTNSLETRANQHLYDASSGCKSIKSQWIRDLLAVGEYPTMNVLEICTEHNHLERELFWIEQFRLINPDMKNRHDCVKSFPTGKARTERFLVSLSTEEMRMFHALADVNAGGSLGCMFRVMIRRMYIGPAELGFARPRKEKKLFAQAFEPPKKTKGDK
jgi:hypothetical protein